MPSSQRILIASSILGIALVLWSIAPLKGYEGDIQHYKYWMLLVTRDGIGAAYSGEPPKTHAVYPPIFVYFLKAIGTSYQLLVDRSLDAGHVLASNGLSVAIKSPGIIFHLLLTLALMLVHYQEMGFRKAYFTGLLYGLNPAAIFAVAYWGQPDSIHTFFLVVGVAALLGRQPFIGWLLIGAAAFTKAQAWLLLPLAVVLTWRESQKRGLGHGAVALLAMSLLLSAPFWITGTLGDLVGLPSTVAGVPEVNMTSWYASNLWWLIVRGSVPDSLPWVLGVSYATWGYLFVAILAISAIALLLRADERDVPEIFALMAFGFVMLATKMHENHTFQTVGLLAIGGLIQRERILVYGAISATLLVNMVLFTPDIFNWLQNELSYSSVIAASMFNALLNLEILAVWLYVLVRRQRGSRERGGAWAALEEAR